MISKICRAPAGGGSARGNVRYILGYALGDKIDAVKARDDYAQMMDEAMTRADFGAGRLWSPEAGEGRRPSSIYAANVTSLATADLEFESTASANPRARESTMHLVFSLSPRIERSDEEFVTGIRETLDRMGVGHYQYVVAVHRDTDHIHAHVALGTVDPQTHRALDRTWLWERTDRAVRETEIARGWEHDHGLIVVRDAGLATQRLERSTYAERQIWAQERTQWMSRERADALERRRYQTYQDLERSFERYAAATIAPRLREVGERSRELGEAPTWTELHKKAAEYGTEIVVRADADPASHATLEDLELVEVRRDKDGQRIEGGDRVRLMDVARESDLSDVGSWRTMDDAEQDFSASLEADASLVTRRIAREQSTFGRDDLVRYVGDRLSDSGEAERLVEHIVRHDPTLRVVSVDGRDPIYSTSEMVEVEERLAEHASELAGRRVEGFNRRVLDEAIADVERDLSTSEKRARLSDEQRAMVAHLDRGFLVAIGDPGVGKTVGMRVAQKYAAAMGLEIVGLTTSQAAALRLQTETRVTTYNTARGERLELLGEQVIPESGILILDESGMMDSRTTERLFRIARERKCQVICVGDTKQLQPILSGQALRISRQAARDGGSFVTLVGIQRQRNDWHRQSVTDLADGLRAVETTGRVDGEKVTRAIERLVKNKVFEQHDDLKDMVQAAATLYVADRAVGVEAVYLAASNETRRYANEAIRARLGFAGEGRQVDTRYGPREIAAGDLLVLRENDTKLGVVNGDRVTVERVTERGMLDVMDAAGRKFRINPNRYDAIDHGYVISYHASQGASVERCVMLLDKAASAELFFVGASRSKGSLLALYHRGSFADVDEIAEHVASRSTLKTTSQTFSEVVERGRGTRTIPDPENHPLRPAYERAEAVKRGKRDTAFRELHERYAERRKSEMVAGSNLLERLQIGKRIEREQRREAAAIVKQYAPTQFGRYVHDETQRQERLRAALAERETQRVRSDTRETQRVAERGRTISIERTSEDNRERGRGNEIGR